MPLTLRTLFFGRPEPRVSHIDLSLPNGWSRPDFNEHVDRLGAYGFGTHESPGRRFKRYKKTSTSPKSSESSMLDISSPTSSSSEEIKVKHRDRKRGKVANTATSAESALFKLDDFDAKKIAIISRVFVLVLQIFARQLLPSHENDGFKTPRIEGNFLDHVVNTTLGGLHSWDGEYFLHISTLGYTHLNTIAFFPLFPTVVSYMTYLLHYLSFQLLTTHSSAILIGWCLNTWIFMESAKGLQTLVKHMDRGMTGLTPCVTYLFCFNPASIFFSAFYSESLFFYLTINMMVALYKGKLERAIFFASLGAVCRSNGLLNFGFIVAFVIRDSFLLLEQPLITIVIDVTRKFLYCVMGVIPFLYFQLYCVWKFCDRVIKTSEDLLPFCQFGSLPYSYVQATNWNVGFMGYFKYNQIPNFILAMPVLYIMATQAWKRVNRHGKSVVEKAQISHLPDLAMACHGLFLVTFCFFFTHVQISTRMIMSSCPYLYIYIAKEIRSETYEFRSSRKEWLPYSFTIHTWFGLYLILGTVMFSLGLPWT